MKHDIFELAGNRFTSRLLVGSARYPDSHLMRDSINASGAQIVTVSLRRRGSDKQGIVSLLREGQYTFLPNTSGCYTAKDAILTAQLAREALDTNWIKLEVIGDEKTLYPHARELLSAAESLVGQGFAVFPYCSDDLVVCKQLEQIGCAAIMPLAAPIGSGMGLCNPYALGLLREKINIPIIVDAGIGTPSDVVLVMEMGVDAVLVNSAIALAQKPVAMAEAMRHAAIAGRLGFLGGRMPRQYYGAASSPKEGMLC